MQLVKINDFQWVRAEAIAAIDSQTETPTIEGIRYQARATKFLSATGAVLVTMEGKQPWSTDPEDSNFELKVMHARHDEAIRAVVEGTNARRSTDLAEELHRQRR